MKVFISEERAVLIPNEKYKISKGLKAVANLTTPN